MRLKSPADKRRFILENTTVGSPPHVPELNLHLADEAHELWLKTEQELEAIGLPPPFWAFAWAGGQGLARYILDNRHIVDGRTVLDLATGSGLVAIAAARAGAKKVTANDIDPFCGAAAALNSEINNALLAFDETDFVATEKTALENYEVILAGDVFYDQAMAKAFERLLRRTAANGKTVLVGDPGRAYFPKSGMKLLETYRVPVTKALEDSDVKLTRVWQVDPSV